MTSRHRSEESLYVSDCSDSADKVHKPELGLPRSYLLALGLEDYNSWVNLWVCWQYHNKD